MVVGGICACCGKYSPALYTCKACGSRCCPNCIDPKTGFCRMCSGIKRVGGAGARNNSFRKPSNIKK